MSGELQLYEDQLDSYEHRAELMRQIYSDLYSKYKWQSHILTIGIIFSSTIVAIASIADADLFIKLLNFINIKNSAYWVGNLLSAALIISGFGVLFLSLLDILTNWRDEYLKYESCVKLLTDLINSINEINDLIKYKTLLPAQVELKVGEIKERYLLICKISPLIDDQNFLDSKQKYLIKRNISENLSKDPYTNVDLGRTIMFHRMAARVHDIIHFLKK